MHELTIANGLLETVCRVAAENGAVRVQEIEVVCGVLRQVVPEALELAFEALSVGTPAEGARLRISEEAIRARCRECGAQFDAAIDNYLCAECRTADVEILAGQDVILKSMVCAAEEAAAR